MGVLVIRMNWYYPIDKLTYNSFVDSLNPLIEMTVAFRGCTPAGTGLFGAAVSNL